VTPRSARQGRACAAPPLWDVRASHAPRERRHAKRCYCRTAPRHRPSLVLASFWILAKRQYRQSRTKLFGRLAGRGDLFPGAPASSGPRHFGTGGNTAGPLSAPKREVECPADLPRSSSAASQGASTSRRAVCNGPLSTLVEATAHGAQLTSIGKIQQSPLSTLKSDAHGNVSHGLEVLIRPRATFL
jgi:hypothetical protein